MKNLFFISTLVLCSAFLSASAQQGKWNVGVGIKNPTILWPANYHLKVGMKIPDGFSINLKVGVSYFSRDVIFHNLHDYVSKGFYVAPSLSYTIKINSNGKFIPALSLYFIDCTEQGVFIIPDDYWGDYREELYHHFSPGYFSLELPLELKLSERLWLYLGLSFDYMGGPDIGTFLSLKYQIQSPMISSYGYYAPYKLGSEISINYYFGKKMPQ